MDKKALTPEPYPLSVDINLACAKAVDVLGVTTLINKAKETLSELHLALDRLQSNPTCVSMDEMIKSIAGVTIATQQLSLIYGMDKVCDEIARMVDSLEDTIDAFTESLK